MSSSMERLTNLLANQLFEPSSTQRQKKERLYDKSKPEGDPTTWSNEDISNILNVKPRGEEQLEAGLFISSMLTGKRFFPIDEHIIKQTNQAVRDAAIALQSGQHLEYLKLSDKLSVTVAFPTAMGLPFVFSLTTPTLLHAKGHLQTQLQVNSESPLNITAEFHFVMPWLSVRAADFELLITNGSKYLHASHATSDAAPPSALPPQTTMACAASTPSNV